MSLVSFLILAVVLLTARSFRNRVTFINRYISSCRAVEDGTKSPLDREMDKVEKGLSHIKYNKYAPTPDEAKNMTSDVFRSTIYRRMKDAELERRKEQGNRVGNAVSDDYLDSLNGGSKKNIASALIATFISLGLAVDVTSAQTPNMDQYNQGSGSYVGKRTAPVQSPPEVASKVKSYGDLKEAINTVRKYVSNQNWNDVILVIGQMKAGVNSGNSVLKESLKDEFVFYIDQVNDLAIENRVLFFNKEDLEQVQMIKDAGKAAAERSKAAIDEASQIIDTIEKLIG